MTRSRARTAANTLMVSAMAAAAVAVVRNRRLRRAAWVVLTATIPRYLVREVVSAWRETGAHAVEPASRRPWDRAA